MTSFERSLTTADRFVDAAAAVCDEARRLGARCTFVALLHTSGQIALCVDDALDDCDDRACLTGPLLEDLRAHPTPRILDHALFVPLVGAGGVFGVVVCRLLGPVSVEFERDFAMLATRLSVWCADHGVTAVPRLRPNQQLGPRQRQIAELATRGLTNDEIAEATGLSINTVKGRLKEVFEILDVRNRTELVHVLRALSAPAEVPKGTTRVGAVTVRRAS